MVHVKWAHGMVCPEDTEGSCSHGQLKSGGHPKWGLASMFHKVSKGFEQALVNTVMRLLVP